MKVPLNWLKEYITIEESPAHIAKLLTMAGLEVDAIENVTPPFTQVVVAEVLRTEKHSDADKLQIAHVSDGTTEYQVVCGAPNCRPGIKTALALVGATLDDGTDKPFKVKKSKIRGVESSGMLCSEKELGISLEHEGIIEFAPQIALGAGVAEMYGNTIFEISLTPNLAHCMCVLGVARELSAITGFPLRYPRITLEETQPLTKDLVSIDVKAKEKCPRYLARVISNIKIGDSPDWLKKRLTDAGIRPINNVVDVTNFVMMEIGHPLHAFDLSKVVGKQVIVRTARENETIVTLDGKTRALVPEDLLICDKDKAIAIAGVMGGLNSEIDGSTTTIVIESAYFNPSTIRKTSKRLGLMSDASKRFERGTDPNGALVALDRAAMMIHQLSGGSIAEGYIDVKEQEFKPLVLECRLNRIQKILGIPISASEVENVFHRLDWLTTYDGQNTFTMTVPTYRSDVKEEIDLIEEVARIYGYDNIHSEAPRYPTTNIPHSPLYLLEKETRARLIQRSLQELLTCDLIGPSLLELVKDNSMPKEAFIQVKNPTSIEQSILRTSLLPSLLEVAKYNFDRQNSDLAGFEIGKVHFKANGQYREQSVAGIILMGKSSPAFWREKPADVDYYTIKGVVETFLKEMGIPKIDFKARTIPNLHPGRQASLFVGDLEIGSIGEVHPDLLRRLDLPQRVYFAEINLQDLQEVRTKDKKMEELPIYPGSDRDWTVTLDDRFPMQEVLRLVEKSPSKFLEKFYLIDIYRNDKLGPHGLNATFRFCYRDRKKTISQEDVDGEHARILAKVQEQLSHELAKLG